MVVERAHEHAPGDDYFFAGAGAAGIGAGAAAGVAAAGCAAEQA